MLTGDTDKSKPPTPPEDDYSYVSVPPNRTFYVRTRYVYAGKGMPRPFDLDDDDNPGNSNRR